MTLEPASTDRALGMASVALSMVAGILALVALFRANSSEETVLALVAGLLAVLGPASGVKGWPWAGLALTLAAAVLALALLLGMLG